jgi:hypothetical protein
MENFLQICNNEYLQKNILNFNIQDFLPPGIKIIDKLKTYFENYITEKNINEIIYPLIIVIKEFYKFNKLEFKKYFINNHNFNNNNFNNNDNFNVYMILFENGEVIINNNNKLDFFNNNHIIFLFS